jgi:hypothetical protein
VVVGGIGVTVGVVSGVGVDVRIAVATGMRVAVGAEVLVGGIGVAVSVDVGTGVDEGMRVAVGSGVFVGGIGVAVGGTRVGVGVDTGTARCSMVTVRRTDASGSYRKGITRAGSARVDPDVSVPTTFSS